MKLKVYKYLCLVAVVSASHSALASEHPDLKSSLLCLSYFYGDDENEQNYHNAFNACYEASKLNDPRSLTLLAELYVEGKGIDKNIIKAGALYEKAAHLGHRHAQLMTYMVYNYLLGDQSTQEQKELGIKFLHESKDNGYAKAIKVYEGIYGK
jgi:TPR repeat protein